MQIVSIRDNLHEMSKLVFWEKYNFLVIFWISLVKFVEKCHSSRPQQWSESKIKFTTQKMKYLSLFPSQNAVFNIIRNV